MGHNGCWGAALCCVGQHVVVMVVRGTCSFVLARGLGGLCLTWRSNGTQGARSTMVGPCGLGHGWAWRLATWVGAGRVLVVHRSLSLGRSGGLQGPWTQLGNQKDPHVARRAGKGGPRDIAKRKGRQYC